MQRLRKETNLTNPLSETGTVQLARVVRKSAAPPPGWADRARTTFHFLCPRANVAALRYARRGQPDEFYIRSVSFGLRASPSLNLHQPHLEIHAAALLRSLRLIKKQTFFSGRRPLSWFSKVKPEKDAAEKCVICSKELLGAGGNTNMRWL